MANLSANERRRPTDDMLNDANAERAAHLDDNDDLTPPLSLVGGDAAENPDAAEERDRRVNLDAPETSRRSSTNERQR